MSAIRESVKCLISSGYFNANEVAEKMDIPTNEVYRIFKGEVNLDNITLKNAEKLAVFWDYYRFRDYHYTYDFLKKSIEEDDTLYELAYQWLQIDDGSQLLSVLAEQYQQAANGVDDFDISVRDYLSLSLEQASFQYE